MNGGSLMGKGMECRTTAPLRGSVNLARLTMLVQSEMRVVTRQGKLMTKAWEMEVIGRAEVHPHVEW